MGEVWPGSGGSSDPTEAYCKPVGIVSSGDSFSDPDAETIYFYSVADQVQPATTSESKAPIQRVFDHILSCVSAEREVENLDFVLATINEYVEQLQLVDFVTWAMERGEMIESDDPASMFADYENFRGPDGDINLDALFAD